MEKKKAKPPMYIDPVFYVKASGEENVEDHFICTVCTGVIYDPLECEICSHMFCKECIDKYESKCPNTCENAKFQKIHRIFKSDLEKLSFKCQNYPRCNVQVKYDEYRQHYDQCIVESYPEIIEELQEENKKITEKSQNQEKEIEEYKQRIADLEQVLEESQKSISRDGNNQEELKTEEEDYTDFDDQNDYDSKVEVAIEETKEVIEEDIEDFIEEVSVHAIEVLEEAKEEALEEAIENTIKKKGTDSLHEEEDNLKKGDMDKCDHNEHNQMTEKNCLNMEGVDTMDLKEQKNLNKKCHHIETKENIETIDILEEEEEEGFDRNPVD
eukprot:403366466